MKAASIQIEVSGNNPADIEAKAIAIAQKFWDLPPWAAHPGDFARFATMEPYQAEPEYQEANSGEVITWTATITIRHGSEK